MNRPLSAPHAALTRRGQDDNVLIVTTVGSPAQLLGPLACEEASVFAVDACADHARQAELVVAALKCLDEKAYREMIAEGPPRRRESIYRARVRWLLSPSTAAAWDVAIETWTGDPLPRALPFETLKTAVARLILVPQRLDLWLESLPDRCVDEVFVHEPAGMLARRQIARVQKRERAALLAG